MGRGGGFGTPHGTVTRALVSAGSKVVLPKVTIIATPGNTIFSDLGAEAENGQTMRRILPYEGGTGGRDGRAESGG